MNDAMKDPTEMFLGEIGSKGRFRMMRALLHKSLSVNEMVETTGLSQTHVSHNLKRLQMCRMVTKKVKGRIHEYSLSKEIAPCIKGIEKYMGKYENFLIKCGMIKGD